MARQASILTEQPETGGVAMLDQHDFALRHVDFAGMEGPETTQQPYTPFAPAIWLGFEDGASVMSSAGKCEDGSEALFLNIQPGPSRWMSLELGLSADGVLETGMAMAAITAAAMPRAEIAAMLRLPTDGETGFVDTPRQPLVLGPQLRKSFVSISNDGVTLAPNGICPRPVLLLFMPLRDLTLCIRRISFGPAA